MRPLVDVFCTLIGGGTMKLRIHITGLSANDADGLLRDFTRHGAEGKIAFGFGDKVGLLVTQEGTLEDLLSTASVAFHEEHFNVGFSN